MAFDWLHMPSENGYNRMRHLSRTPPEYWSRRDRSNAGRERSKYIRARNKGMNPVIVLAVLLLGLFSHSSGSCS